MDDFGDSELDTLVLQLKRGLERRNSLVASNEDISGTHESLDSEWDKWMCPECGIFMKENHGSCVRCGILRF